MLTKKYLDDLTYEIVGSVFVENCLVVELKAVQEMNSIFEAQLLTYMKLLQVPKGLLINFNCSNIFHEGQKTFVNRYFGKLADD